MIDLIDLKINENFEESFTRAENTFKHQLVLNPANGAIIPVSPYLNGKTAMDYPFAGNPDQAEVNK